MRKLSINIFGILNTWWEWVVNVRCSDHEWAVISGEFSWAVLPTPLGMEIQLFTYKALRYKTLVQEVLAPFTPFEQVWCQVDKSIIVVSQTMWQMVIRPLDSKAFKKSSTHPTTQIIIDISKRPAKLGHQYQCGLSGWVNYVMHTWHRSSGLLPNSFDVVTRCYSVTSLQW